VLFDERRRSSLIFRSSQGSTEPTHLDQLRRVREPVSRSKSGVQGKVADVIHGRSRHAESQNELKAFQLLLATARADAWQEQPFILEYHHEGAKRRYTPDVLVIWRNHQQVVEVKEDSEAELPESRARFTLIDELLAEHGYHFRLWKESEICAEPRFTNANLVLRYRSVGYRKGDAGARGPTSSCRARTGTVCRCRRDSSRFWGSRVLINLPADMVILLAKPDCCRLTYSAVSVRWPAWFAGPPHARKSPVPEG